MAATVDRAAVRIAVRTAVAGGAIDGTADAVTVDRAPVQHP